jgi:hypothetical protein
VIKGKVVSKLESMQVNIRRLRLNAHMTVVTTQYRYKRLPRKRKPAAPLEGPAIVTIRDKKRVTPEKVLAEVEPKAADPAPTQAAAAPAESTSVTVTAGRKRAGASAAPVPGIVTATDRKLAERRRQERRVADQSDNPDANARARAFIRRVLHLPPEAS